MGTRINALFEHELTDHRDRDAILASLASTLPAALAVRTYWLANAPIPATWKNDLSEWRANPDSPRDRRYQRYTGPGSLFLTVTPKTANVHTGGRWRGFLSIEPLRRVHLNAFQAVSAAMGASYFALFPDLEEVDELLWDGRSAWACIERLEQIWGPPQKSVEDIQLHLVAAAEHTVPQVWFLESVEARVQMSL
jgi:hypothetical protein